MNTNSELDNKYQVESKEKVHAKNKLIEAETRIDTLNKQIRSLKTLHDISNKDVDLLKARLDARDNEIIGHKQELQNFQEKNDKIHQENLGFQVTKKELDKYISRILMYLLKYSFHLF